MCNLVNALVLPVLCHDGEVWFWHHEVSNMVTKVLAGVHHQFLQGLLGVKFTMYHLIALAELGRYWLAVHWQKQSDKFRLRTCDPTHSPGEDRHSAC